MNNLFLQNSLYAIVFELPVILFIMEGSQKVAITHLAIGIDTQVTHHVVVMEKVAEYHILTKSSKFNTSQVVSDLVHDFMNFIVLKLFKNFVKK